MEIGKDKFVIIEYTLRFEDGFYLKGEDGPVSMNFIAGYDQLLPALERRLFGLEEGVEVEFVIPAREAFGEYDPAFLQTKPFSEFPQGRDLPVGKWVKATSDQTQTQYSYFVKDKTEDAVTLDFNHPLAGKDLYYHIKVVKVRPAFQDELEYLRPCETREDDSPSLSFR